MLDGKSVVITGSGSGVGRACAVLFAHHGARLICADLRPDWNEATVRLITNEGGTAIALSCDVAVAADVGRAVDAALSEFGQLDIMFNNAGIASSQRGILLEEHSDDEFDRLVAVNVRGTFHGCRAAVRQFKRQATSGVIVNTASIAGIVGLGSTVYGATKAMVIQMTRGLAIEGAPFGIRVNCICPGGMLTNFGVPENHGYRVPSASDEELARSMHPLGNLITPQDCASAALFLASEHSRNVTGVALPIDGGYIAK